MINFRLVMGWKDWPYWVKGLIIGIVIFGAIFLLSFIYGTTVCEVEDNDCQWGLAFLIFFSFFIIPLSTIISWIYGKIKNK